MKISYGITVYNEHKELDNLLFHLSKHIRDEDEVVLHKTHQRLEKSILFKMSMHLEKVLEKYEYGTYFTKNLKVNTFEFRKDFAALKNYTKSHCSGRLYISH